MALSKELTATQLLQGLQKKDPRMYDLINIIIQNVEEINPNQPRTLRKSTTGGIPADVDNEDVLWYNAKKLVSIRV